MPVGSLHPMTVLARKRSSPALSANGWNGVGCCRSKPAKRMAAMPGRQTESRQSVTGPDPAVFKIGGLSTSSAPGSPKEGSTLRLSLSPQHRAGWTVESRLSLECAWEGIARFHHTKTSRSTSRSASPSSGRIPKDCGILTSPVSRGSRKRSLVHF